MENDKWFLSSTGSGDLSLTLQGLLASVPPLIVLAFSYFGIHLDKSLIVDLITAVWGIISACMVIAGVARKITVAIKSNSETS